MTDAVDLPRDRALEQRDDERDAALTLHEERLVASEDVTSRQVGQVHLRKRVVVEDVTVTVPVRREVVDVVRVEADGTETVLEAAPALRDLQVEDRTGRAAKGKASGREAAPHREGGDGVVCYEERPVLTTEVFAVERVRLDVTRATRTETETHEVRREEVEFVETPTVETGR